MNEKEGREGDYRDGGNGGGQTPLLMRLLSIWSTLTRRPRFWDHKGKGGDIYRDADVKGFLVIGMTPNPG